MTLTCRIHGAKDLRLEQDGHRWNGFGESALATAGRSGSGSMVRSGCGRT